MTPPSSVAPVAETILRNVLIAARFDCDADAAARSVFLLSISEEVYAAAIDWLMVKGLINAVVLRTPAGDCVKVEVIGPTVQAHRYIAVH